MLDLDPTLFDIDPETLASWYADLSASRSGHRPYLDTDELISRRHGSSEHPARIRRILTPRWDPTLSPQVLAHWLSLAPRLPAAADEARGLAFLQSLHALGARPGWPGDDRLPKTGGTGPLQLPTWRSSEPTHPTPIPLAAWQEAASRAVQKGLLSAPSSPFNHSPSLRDLQISAPGSGPEVLRFASLLASAAGLPPDASLAPPLSEISPPPPPAAHGTRVASDNAPRLPFPPWAIKPSPSPITIDTIAEASRLFRLLESDPSTAVPPTRSSVPQPDRSFRESPPELQGDETGAADRTSFKSPTPVQRLAYREWAHDYLRAYEAADPSTQSRLPHPSTIPSPDTLMSADESASASMRLRHLTLLAKGITPNLATSGPAVRSLRQSAAASERLRLSHSPKRPNPLQELEDLAQGLRTPRADVDDADIRSTSVRRPSGVPATSDVQEPALRKSKGRPPVPANRISKGTQPPPDRKPKTGGRLGSGTDGPEEPVNAHLTHPFDLSTLMGTRGGQSMGATRGRNLARKAGAGRTSGGPGGAAVNRIWQSWEDLGTAFPPASGDIEGNARAPSPKGGEAHIVRDRQKPVSHASSRERAAKIDRQALGRLVAMFMLRIAEGMKAP